MLTSVVLATPNARPLRPWPSPARRRRWLLKTTIAGRRTIPGCSFCPSLLPSRSLELAAHARVQTGPHWPAAPASESSRRTPGPPLCLPARALMRARTRQLFLPLEEVPPAPSGLIAVLPWVAATRSRAAAPGPVHICGRLRQVPYLGLRPVPLPDWQGVVSARLKYPPIGATLVATPQID